MPNGPDIPHTWESDCWKSVPVAHQEEEQLTQQIQQIQLQNDRSFPAWFWSSSTALLTALAALVTAYLVFIQWKGSLDTARAKDAKDREGAQDKELKDRQDERAKQAEERFQKVVEELGNEKEEGRVGGVILLHTFLEPGYEQFYRQVFRLAVAYLRLQPFCAQANELWGDLQARFACNSSVLHQVTRISSARSRRDDTRDSILAQSHILDLIIFK